MAYISQETKKELAPAIKAVLKKYGMKGTIGIDRHTSLRVRVKEGPLKFDNYEQVNTYHIEKFYGEETKETDIAYYIDIHVGQWDKPYVQTA